MSASSRGTFRLGAAVDPASHDRLDEPLLYESGDLTTHGIIVGMTGSGKTGLAVDLLEEALAGWDLGSPTSQPYATAPTSRSTRPVRRPASRSI